MLLVYIDESYKRHRDYWLVGCAIHDEEVGELCEGVRASVARIPTEFGIPVDVELHAQHLWHGEQEFAPLKEAVRARIQCYRRGLEALCGSGAAVFFVGVKWNDTLSTHHRLTTHRLAALRHLLPHVEAHAESRQERCLIIADEEETSTEEVVAVVREHQASYEAQDARSRILDAPLFTPSHHSHGVQACDLVAFLRTRRAFARPDEDKRAKKVLQDWWTLVKPYALVDQCYPAPSDMDAMFAEKVISES